MGNTKKQDQAQLKFIDELLQRQENQFCADCKIKGPRWASVNIGCFLCIRCAGIHRKLGTHISKVKSTNLDIWQQDWLEFVASMGNEKVNQLYLSRGNAPHVNHQSDSEMDEYIRNKYEKRMFATGMGGNSGNGHQETSSSSAPSPTSASAPGAAHYARQLETMAAMGFTNQAACISALEKSKGSIERAVESMVGKSPVTGAPPRLEEPPQRTGPNPNASYQIQLNHMGFSNLESNEKAYQIANGNMESTVSILIEWQASQKRKSVDVGGSGKSHAPPGQRQAPVQQQPQTATADLLDIFSVSAPQQQQFGSIQQNDFTNSLLFQGQGTFTQNQFSNNPFGNQQSFQQQQQQQLQQKIFFQPQQSSFPAPQAPFQPQQSSFPAPQAPYQPQQAASNPFLLQQRSQIPPQQLNPFATEQQQQQNSLPFVNPQLMLFQQPAKPTGSMDTMSTDDFFKMTPKQQPAPGLASNNQQQQAFEQLPSQLFGGSSVGTAQANTFGQPQSFQPQQQHNQMQFNNNPQQQQSNPFQTQSLVPSAKMQPAPIQNPQEKLLQDQQSEFEQKKSRDIQKDTILSMYRAAPPQQPQSQLNYGFGGQQGAANSGGNMQSQIPYGLGLQQQQQQQYQQQQSQFVPGFGYGNQPQLMNQQFAGGNNMYEPRMANMNQMPRSQQQQAAKPDMAGDIFKAASNSQTNLNNFTRVQDKNSNLLGDLNLFGK